MQKGTLLAVLSCALAVSVRAQTYFLMSESTNGMSGPPWPFNPCPSATVYPQGDNKYLVDDRSSVVTFSSSGTTMMSDEVAPPDPTDTNNVSTNYVGNWLISPMDSSFLTNGSLWIEAYSNDTQNIYLQLHNTTNAYLYQIFSTTNLASPITSWMPGQFQNGDSTTNVTVFNPVSTTNGQTFFRGERGETVIFAYWQQDAYETNATLGIGGQVGRIDFDDVPNATNDLIVHYTLGGSARNGVDYTNLSGMAVIPANQGFVSVYVQPTGPGTLTNAVESAVFAIEPSTNYLVSPDHNSVPIWIKSSSTTISIDQTGTDAIRPAAPGEPAVYGSIYLHRNDYFGNYDQPLTAYYQVSGTASNGVDYQLLSGSITFNEFLDTNITIVPLAESPPQGTKYLTLTVVSSNGYVADSNFYSGNLAIYDQLDTVSVFANDTAINSNGPTGAPAQDCNFTISRSEPSGFYPPVTVKYEMSGTASNGLDYSNLSGTVAFDNGQQTAVIPIAPINTWTNVSKTVIMTLLSGDYFISTNQGMATDLIDNSSTKVTAVADQDAFEPTGTSPGRVGFFTLQRVDTRGYYNPLTVHYSLTGSATNGIDYTNLSGVVTFGQYEQYTNVYIQPLINTNVSGDKTVTLTPLPATTYYSGGGATLVIVDTNNDVQFQTVTNLGLMVGSDYSPYLTNLIVSVNGGYGGYDFWRLGTNITVVGGSAVTNLNLTNWSGINGLSDEVYLTVVTNSMSGFTNGDMFFGSDTGVGWLSSNAAMSNLTWCRLTNATETNSFLLRGSLCMDTVGTFSNNLIAVTSDGISHPGLKGVWEVDSRGNSTLLTNISASLLEGAIVVPTNFGPWSGKILTGDENSTSLYTIDNHGNLTNIDSTLLYPGGIHCESIQVIPSNQSLYLCDPYGPIVKLSKSYFTNYVGDLLIEDGGEAGVLYNDAPAKLFIVHWDAVSSSFTARCIRYNYGSTELEHCVFAPIELPAH